MIAGSLFVFGRVGRYAGAGMKRGTIAALGPEPPELLPSFAASGRYRFPFLALYLKRLAQWGLAVPGAVLSAEVERYNGDLADGGQGEFLVGAGTNERPR
jgi:formylmethanofuran dehydrogenase subunit C